MNENNKSFMYGCVVGVLVGFLLCYTMQGRNNTSNTISTIKEQQHAINNEIRNASNGVGNAQNTVERASSTISGVQERLGRSQQIASDNAKRIDSCAKIVSECRGLAEENRAIINNVGKTDSGIKEK